MSIDVYTPGIYPISVECTNCGYSGTITLIRGMELNNLMRRTECPTCGCGTLKRNIEE